MRYYFAPMEGITDSVYRRLHSKHFSGVDRYYMPFLSPTQHRTLTHREERELPMADSVSFTAVPQVLTKVAEDFLWAAEVCADRGYTEVNLNTGCPSGTVTAKGKGAGMLRDPEELDRFLDTVCAASAIPVSVKTRLGYASSEEFPRLLEIFNRYPIKELAVHPRVRADFYKGPVDMAAFAWCLENSKNPVCYNGDLTSMAQVEEFSGRYPQVEAVMLGRGLVGDPGMLSPGGTDMETLKAFHDELVEEYRVVFGSARNSMFRMKDIWRLLICRFDGGEKLWKRLRKSTDLADYLSITNEIFQALPLSDSLHPDW